MSHVYQNWNYINARRACRLQETIQWRSNQLLQGNKKSTKLESIEDQKYLKVVPHTATVIFSWDRKALIFHKLFQNFFNS